MPRCTLLHIQHQLQGLAERYGFIIMCEGQGLVTVGLISHLSVFLAAFVWGGICLSEFTGLVYILLAYVVVFILQVKINPVYFNNLYKLNKKYYEIMYDVNLNLALIFNG